MVRKIPMKKLEAPVKTFNDLAVALTKIIVNAARNSGEIHVVFDTYKEDSTRNAERKRRGKSNEMIVVDSISPSHRIPVKLENVWSSSVSKTTFQAFYAEWLRAKYSGTKPLYLGISPNAWSVWAGRACPFPRLDCTHEEADDRMMFHVQDILLHQCGPTSITLFLCLSALHALTGCDTTSKIATKLATLKAVRTPENLQLLVHFNCSQLTDNATQSAELFLVKCLKPSTHLETFDKLRLDTFDNNALKLDFEKTTCTSTNIRMHVRRRYYQMQLWIQAPFRDATKLLNA